MLGLYLIASHMVGDFVFQTRWQAASKLDDWRARARHVSAYTLAFLPLVTWLRGTEWLPASDWREWRGVVFLVLLWLLHFATDSRRFHSTLGDMFVWKFGGLEREVADKHMRSTSCPFCGAPATRFTTSRLGLECGRCDVPPKVRLKPNPWESLPIVIDQTLHLVQLAVLGGIFLS